MKPTKIRKIKELHRLAVVLQPAFHHAHDRLCKSSDNILIEELNTALTKLSTELFETRADIRQASDASSKHAKALVFATWVLAIFTGVLAVATLLMRP